MENTKLASVQHVINFYLYIVNMINKYLLLQELVEMSMIARNLL